MQIDNHGNEATKNARVGSSWDRPWYMDVEEENVDDICMLMNITRENLEALKASENIPFDPNKYPSIEQMTSYYKKRVSRRGRCHSFGFDRIEPKDKKGDAGVEFSPEALEEILLKNMPIHERMFEIMKCIGIEGKMITTTQEEELVSTCLHVLLTKYIGDRTTPCLEFIGQVVGRSGNAHEMWKGAFWTTYEDIIEARTLSGHHIDNFSNFMAGVYNLSKRWINHKTRHLITGDLLCVLEKVIRKMGEYQNSKERSEILTSFLKNFMSKVTEVRRPSSSGHDDFSLKLKSIIESSDLKRHQLNLFLAFLDPELTSKE